MQRFHSTMDDTALRCRSISSVEMEHNLEWSSVEAWTYVAEMSGGCKQSMFPETVAQQDASSSTERLVADMTFATRTKVKTPKRNQTVLQCN